ncbi:hypothetical protein PIB30_097385 [Stylosanthes scabra]|uniref:Uncharacterized protein n=1 Tax=Stylosanthes scabra TaxID=79078 RepID=A0ABU6YXN7_9FABA|nr:hypothetical protein [Stylosanthes scabra]
MRGPPRLCVVRESQGAMPKPGQSCLGVDRGGNGRTWRTHLQELCEGVPIDFSPENIRTVMRFRAQVQGSRCAVKRV